MDPLSVTASVIAVVQAVGSIGQGVNYLRSLSKAPTEFHDFLNELVTLQATSEQVRGALETLKDKDVPPQSSALQHLQRLVDELNKTVTELEALQQRFASASIGRNKDGLLKIPKLQWRRERTAILELNKRVRNTKSNLMLAMDTYGVTQVAQLQAHIILEVRNAVGSLREDLLRSQVTASEHRDHQSQPQAVEATIVSSRASSIPFDVSHDIQLQATLRQKCFSHCRCSCHRVTGLQTPAWFRSFIGEALLQYRCIPFFGSDACDEWTCKARSASALRFKYKLPEWLAYRAIHIQATWSSMTDSGASLFLRIPRYVQSIGFVAAVRRNDAQWVRIQITRKRLLQSDLFVSKDGTDSPLLVAFIRGNENIAGLLISCGFRAPKLDGRYSLHDMYEVGTRVSVKSFEDHKRQDTDEAEERNRFFAKSQLDESLSLESPATSSTPLHRALLRQTDVPLAKCVELDPGGINSLDEFGFSPLHVAAAHGNISALHILLDSGADVRQPSRHLNFTALHFCMRHADISQAVEVAACLLRHGADVNARNIHGETALHVAVRDNRLARLLLDAGADPSIRSAASGMTAVELIGHYLPSGDLSTFRELLAIFSPLPTPSPYGLERFDLIRSAAWLGNAPLVVALIEAGLDPANAGPSGINLVNIISWMWSGSEARYLRESVSLCGTNPDVAWKSGDTPLNLIFRRQMVRQEGEDYVPETTQVDEWELVALIVKTREENWRKGLYMESRYKEISGTVHADLRRWLKTEHERLGLGEGLENILGPDFEEFDATDSDEKGEKEDAEVKCTVLEKEDEVFYDAEEKYSDSAV